MVLSEPLFTFCPVIDITKMLQCRIFNVVVCLKQLLCVCPKRTFTYDLDRGGLVDRESYRYKSPEKNTGTFPGLVLAP